MISRVARGAFVALVSLVLAACSNGKGSEASQIVAKVDRTGITASQVREALAARGADPVDVEVTRKTIDSLINEQLLVQAALDSELDRDPAVMAAVEKARQQVLARAYAERVVFPRAEISAGRQIEYYASHPELFENRKVYQVMAYTVSAIEMPETVRTELRHARSAEVVSRVLKSRGIKHEVQALTRGAEQLPLEELHKFAHVQVGDVVLMQEHDGRLPMMLITGIQDSPISVERAQPIIEQYLTNLRNSQALEAHLQQARATAKILYFDGASVEGASTTTPARVAGALEPAGAHEPPGDETGIKAISLN